ncbi:hypothetical protein JOQ06_014227, partial [Pogonophryne albipinna]
MAEHRPNYKNLSCLMHFLCQLSPGLGKVNEKIRSAGTPDLLIFIPLTQQLSSSHNGQSLCDPVLIVPFGKSLRPFVQVDIAQYRRLGRADSRKLETGLTLASEGQHPSSPEMTLGMVKPPVEPWCVAVAPVSREVQGPDAGEACSSRSQ